MTKNREKLQVARKIVRLAIFRNFRNWLSKKRQPCDFCDFSQTHEKSQFCTCVQSWTYVEAGPEDVEKSFIISDRRVPSDNPRNNHWCSSSSRFDLLRGECANAWQEARKVIMFKTT